GFPYFRTRTLSTICRSGAGTARQHRNCSDPFPALPVKDTCGIGKDQVSFHCVPDCLVAASKELFNHEPGGAARDVASMKGLHNKIQKKGVTGSAVAHAFRDITA